MSKSRLEWINLGRLLWECFYTGWGAITDIFYAFHS